MPDNTQKVPGSADQSAGSGTPGTTSDAANPNTGSASGDGFGERLMALQTQIEKLTEMQNNQRSFHDRQMTELRNALSSVPRVGAAADTSSQDEPDTGGGETRPAQPDPRELQRDYDLALIKVRQEDPEWDDYKDEVFAITSDRYKAAPFVVRNVDGTTDFYSSLRRIRDHLELTRLRGARKEAETVAEELKQKQATAKRAATISGQSSTVPEVTDFESLSYEEKLKKIAEIAPELIDPRDLPSSLRNK